MKQIAVVVFVVLATILVSLPATARTVGFEISEIIALTKELGKQLDWPQDKIGDLIANLQQAVHNDWYTKEVEQKAVMAVFVYRATEAGLILKVMRGRGLMTFKNGRKAAEISLKSTAVGAHAGGSAEWGVGLVMGLADSASFGGEYSGSMRKATAIDSSTATGVVLAPSYSAGGKSTHQIYLVTTGRGLSAGTGGVRLTITTSW